MKPRQWNARNKYIHRFIEEIHNAASCLSATEAFISKDTGLGLEQWKALATIERSSWMLSISDLARRLRIARQSAHALVANLDRRGLVRLSPNPEDRRLIQIEITPNGKEALHAAELRLHQWLQIMTVDLDDRELCRLIQTLRAIRARIARSRDYA